MFDLVEKLSLVERKLQDRMINVTKGFFEIVENHFVDATWSLLAQEAKFFFQIGLASERGYAIVGICLCLVFLLWSVLMMGKPFGRSLKDHASFERYLNDSRFRLQTRLGARVQKRREDRRGCPRFQAKTASCSE